MNSRSLRRNFSLLQILGLRHKEKGLRMPSQALALGRHNKTGATILIRKQEIVNPDTLVFKDQGVKLPITAIINI